LHLALYGALRTTRPTIMGSAGMVGAVRFELTTSTSRT
jgi:hypothetical protein